MRRCTRLFDNGGSAASRAAQPGDGSAIRSRLSVAGLSVAGVGLALGRGAVAGHVAGHPPGPCWWVAWPSDPSAAVEGAEPVTVPVTWTVRTMPICLWPTTEHQPLDVAADHADVDACGLPG